MATTPSQCFHGDTSRVNGMPVPHLLLSPLAAGVLAAVLLSACSSEPTAISPELERGGSAVALSVSPSTLLLRRPGLSKTFTATVQYSGVLTASSSNPACATVDPTTTTNTDKPEDSSVYIVQFTVTGVGMGGCTITVTDKKGNTSSVRVSVSPIAFQSDRDPTCCGELYLMDADGQTETRLTDNDVIDWEPAWSPDGTKITFEGGDLDSLQIYVMDADGRNRTRLTYNSANNTQPDWSPDGTKIVFVSDRDGTPDSLNFEIYVMDADGRNQTRLTNNSAPLDIEPAWSPDGTKIAFSSDRDAFLQEIYVMDANGGNVMRLTSASGEDTGPAWSPDGTKIAFSTGRVVGETEQIYVMDADGQNQTPLTHTLLRSTHPAWSPDGTKIAFNGQHVEGDDIYVMDADGKNLTQLTEAEPYHNNQFPTWR